MSTGDETITRLERLSAYVDGDLDADDAADVERLLRESEEARTEVDELRRMKAVARDSTEGPRTDLWPAIVEELQREPIAANDSGRRTLLTITAIAAALLLAFYLGRSQTPEPAVANVAPAPLSEQLAGARAAYGAAIDRLLEESEQAAERLSPETRAQLAQSLATVDRAIRETEAAMKAAPEDPFGHETLLALYEEKVRILDATITTAELTKDPS